LAMSIVPLEPATFKDVSKAAVRGTGIICSARIAPLTGCRGEILPLLDAP